VESIPKEAFVKGLTRMHIKKIYRTGIEDTLKLLRLKCLCRIRGLSVDIDNAKSENALNYHREAKAEYEELFRHLDELNFIISDIRCAKKYLSNEEKKEFNGIIYGNPLVRK
jgi:hypothetical protein